MIKLTYKELSEYLGKSEGAVRMDFQRAGLKLSQDNWDKVLSFVMKRKHKDLLERIRAGLDKLEKKL